MIMLKRTHARLLKELESKHRQELIRLHSEAQAERNRLLREKADIASMVAYAQIRSPIHDPELMVLAVSFVASSWLDERWAKSVAYKVEHQLINGLYKYGQKNFYKAFEQEVKP